MTGLKGSYNQGGLPGYEENILPSEGDQTMEQASQCSGHNPKAGRTQHSQAEWDSQGCPELDSTALVGHFQL